MQDAAKSGLTGGKSWLRGWKKIAAYLGRDVRSAQRYEKTRGLPVHREAGDGGPGAASVFAFPGELDEWLEGRKPAESAAVAGASAQLSDSAQPDLGSESHAGRRRSYALALAGGLLLIALLVAGAAFFAKGRARPATVTLEFGRFLAARSADGKALWQKAVASPTASLAVDEAIPPLLADLDHDFSDEIIFAYRTGGEDTLDKDRILCLSGGGEELWSYRPGEELVLGGLAVPDAYYIQRASAAGRRADGTRFVLSVANHRVLGTSQVSVLDHRGRRIGEYWHAGWVFDAAIVDFDRDGVDEIALAGIDEPTGKAFLAMIAATTPRSISPVPDGYAPGMARNTELTYLCFPAAQTDQILRRAVRAFRIGIHTFPDGLTVELQHQGYRDAVERTYLLDDRLEVLWLQLSDEFLLQGQHLEEKGLLPRGWQAAELARLRRLEPVSGPPAPALELQLGQTGKVKGKSW